MTKNTQNTTSQTSKNIKDSLSIAQAIYRNPDSIFGWWTSIQDSSGHEYDTFSYLPSLYKWITEYKEWSSLVSLDVSDEIPSDGNFIQETRIHPNTLNVADFLGCLHDDSGNSLIAISSFNEEREQYILIYTLLVACLFDFQKYEKNRLPWDPQDERWRVWLEENKRWLQETIQEIELREYISSEEKKKIHFHMKELFGSLSMTEKVKRKIHTVAHAAGTSRLVKQISWKVKRIIPE